MKRWQAPRYRCFQLSDRYLNIQHFAEIKPAVNQIETHVFRQRHICLAKMP